MRCAVAWGVLAALAALMLTACSGSGSDIRARLEKDFTRTVGTRTSSSAAYYSARSVAEASDYVRRSIKPNDTISAGAGQFLQYRDAVVGVYDCSQAATVDASARNDVVAGCDQRRTGSVVYVDDYTRGRTRWAPYVGSRWGLAAGLGPSFRGGGSGAGK